jgi:hypothetical protein
MHYRISADHDNGLALESLQDWLRGDSSIPVSTTLVRLEPREGQMGGVIDALTVAVGGGGALTALASALHIWLQQPKWRTLHLKVTSTPSGDRTVEISAHALDASEVESLLRSAFESK